MGDIVNLNRARKAKAREAAAAKAAENRAIHGRTGAERARDREAAATLRRAVDGAALEGRDRETGGAPGSGGAGGTAPGEDDG